MEQFHEGDRVRLTPKKIDELKSGGPEGTGMGGLPTEGIVVDVLEGMVTVTLGSCMTAFKTEEVIRVTPEAESSSPYRTLHTESVDSLMSIFGAETEDSAQQ